MSKGRVFSRPRTKVYDSNYNIGESYYKSALDQLDRKYGGRSLGEFDRTMLSNGDLFGMRPPPPPSPMEVPQSRPTLREMDMPQPRSALREMDMPQARSALREFEDEFFGEGTRRRPNSALIGEYDAIFEGRMRNGMGAERPPMRGGRNLDEEIEEDLTSSMKRLRAKTTRSFTDEFAEDMESAFGKKDPRMRPRLDFGEKLMESVGLGGKARQALEEEGSAIGRRRFLKMTSDASEGAEEMTKWTALKPTASGRSRFFEDEEESVSQTAAAARARKSRARLDDLDAEMQAITEKNAAREKRVRDLKALVQDSEGMDNMQTTVRMKSSIQSEKKTLAY